MRFRVKTLTPTQRSHGLEAQAKRAEKLKEKKKRPRSLAQLREERANRAKGGNTPALRLLARARGHRTAMTLVAVILMVLLLSGTTAGTTMPVGRKLITLRRQSVEASKVSYADTVGEFLTQQGIYLGEGDEILPSVNAPLEDGMVVQVDQRMSIVLQIRGQQERIFMNRGTVADALEAAGETVKAEDALTPSQDTLLTDGMVITLVRYDTSTLVQTEALPFETVKVQDPQLYVGESKVIREGQDGVLERVIMVRYQDAVEIDRVLVREQETTRRVNRVIAEGSKPKPTTTTVKATTTAKKTTVKATTKATTKATVKATTKATTAAEKLTIPGLDGGYLEKLTGIEITAYTHTGEKTTIGTWPRASRSLENPGTVAVAPQKIPYHTLLYVPGYGYCVAEDTGGFRDERPYQIDLFMDTEEECNEWGRRRNKTIYIIQYNYKRS